jgi:choline dehydrogenase-like flavoprotein
MNPIPHFDAIVVGSGAGGSAAAHQLANAGLRVAIVEKGRALPRDNSTLDFDKVVHQASFKSKEVWQDGRGRALIPEEYFNLGGKTKWYGAALLRYAPHEFDADPAHQCMAWPFDYTEIAPWYDEAEKLLGVRTFEIEPDLRDILSRLRRGSNAWRAEMLNLGLSASILANRIEASRFDGFASPTDLKSDGETVFLSKLTKRENVTLFTDSTVTDLLGDSTSPRRITGVRLADGRRLQANAVVLAAGALHSPRILSRYAENTGLDAVLPGASLIGRNLKLHLLTALIALSTSRKRDLIRKTAVLLNDALPHSSVQPLGFDGELISTLMPYWLPRTLKRQLGERAYGFFLQTEDGSHSENRVIDAVMPHGTPMLDYDATRLPAASLEHDRLVSTFKLALARAGMIAFSQRISLAGTAHVCGTLITGKDPAHSVVDPFGQVHGMQSLYVVDGSVLPRSSRVNPSLTIYSWSLRVAHSLAMQLVTTPAYRQAVHA